jgi:hypothetical protein
MVACTAAIDQLRINSHANSDMRGGETSNLKIRDLETFEDDLDRHNYRFKVKGKTGERDAILRASAGKFVDRQLTRRSNAEPDDWLFVMGMAAGWSP